MAGGDVMKCSVCTLYSATLLDALGVRATADDAVVRETKEKETHLKVGFHIMRFSAGYRGYGKKDISDKS